MRQGDYSAVLGLASRKSAGKSAVIDTIVRFLPAQFPFSVFGEVRVKLFQEGGEGSASMAEGEFGLEIDLGHGSVECREVEERVVAEASGATGFGENLAFDGSVADGEDVSIARGGQDAVVAGAALSEWDASEK